MKRRKPDFIAKKTVALFLLICSFIYMISPINVNAYEAVTFPVSIKVDWEESRKAMELFNSARSEAGLPELQLEAGLVDEAIQRAAECAVWYSHSRPAGELSTYQVTASGENIGYGQTSAEAFFNSIRNSAGHWAWAMGKEFRSTAIVCAVYPDGDVYWVQLLDERNGDGSKLSEQQSITRQVEISDGNIKFGRAVTTLEYGSGANEEPVRIVNYYRENGQKTGYVPPAGLLLFESSDTNIFKVDTNGYVLPQNAGSASLTVTLKSNPSINSVIPITIKPMDLWSGNNVKYSYVQEYFYTGNPITPEIEAVCCSGELLEENKDYTLHYASNVEVGTGKIYAEGIGNYTGTVCLSFNIQKKQEIIEAEASADAENKNSSTVQFLANFNYVTPTVVLSQDKYFYDGNEKCPEITVIVKGKQLEAGKDYQLTYSNNVNPGYAAVTITGINRCSGSYTVYFFIEEAKVKNAANEQIITIGMQEQIDSTTDSIAGEEKSEETVGEKAVVSKELAVKDITSVKRTDFYRVSISKTKYTYAGKAIKPKVTVHYKNKKINSQYYRITYKNNKKVGTATVIVRGKGKYKGLNKKATFTIIPKKVNIKKISISKKNKMTIKWTRDKQVTGYQIQVARNKKMAASRVIYRVSGKKSSHTIQLEGKRKNYYVRMRSYKKVNGKTIYSTWSSVKKGKR